VNPDFVQVIDANFPKDAGLIIGCQKGGRSLVASATPTSNAVGDKSEKREHARLPVRAKIQKQSWNVHDNKATSIFGIARKLECI
jgi:hypothetical protein